MASGRSSFEHTLAGGGPLTPDDWAWAEAEHLLGRRLHDGSSTRSTSTLQWKTVEVPVGEETSWRPDGEHADDDDPGLPAVATTDEAWEAALSVLLDDEEVPDPSRGGWDWIGLHVVVRDVDEMELSAWEGDDGPDHGLTDATLVVPGGPGLGGGIARAGLPCRPWSP